MSVSLIINADTRKGIEMPSTKIGEYGEGSLQGCRSLDFLTHGVKNKRLFTRAKHTVLFIDEHHTFKHHPEDFKGVDLVVHHKHNEDHPRWNDLIYLNALREAKEEYIVHCDQDVACFRKWGFDYMAQAIDLLDQGYNFVCQPTMLHDHGMSHASTRFFVCKRSLLDFDEIEKCVVDAPYRIKKYGNTHVPCLEHILGLIYGKVIYPWFDDWNNYLIVSWVQYYSGIFSKLQPMEYEKVREYFMDCGIHGANDCVAKRIME